MERDVLLTALECYGADMEGIADRFGSNLALYLECCDDLLSERNWALLRAAVARGDRVAAFASSHALKGLTANLGLTPLLNAMVRLTDTLRGGDGVSQATPAALAETERELEAFARKRAQMRA